MKIPTSNVVAGPQGAPSETEMLMALAEMHRQGRIQTAMKDVVGKFRPSTNIEDDREGKYYENTRDDLDKDLEKEFKDAPWKKGNK